MKVIFYKDTKNEWRWRIRARNGKIIADSGEGYHSKASAKKSFNKIVENFWNLNYYVEGEDD